MTLDATFCVSNLVVLSPRSPTNGSSEGVPVVRGALMEGE